MSNTLTVLTTERDKFYSAARALDEAIKVLTNMGTNGASAPTATVGEGGEVSLVPTKRGRKPKAKTTSRASGGTRAKRVKTEDAVGSIATEMADGQFSVTEIASKTGMSVPTVRRAVKAMEGDALMVQSSKRGKEILYSLTEKGSEIPKVETTTDDEDTETSTDEPTDESNASPDQPQGDEAPDEPAVEVDVETSFGGDTADEQEVSFPTA